MNRILTHTAALSVVLAFAAPGQPALAAPGTVTRTSDLRSAPKLDAAVKGRLASQAKVDIVSTRGGWVEVKSADGSTGWLRLMNVEPAAGRSSGSGLKGLATAGNVARTGSTGSTAATGVKGISKEDLAGAKANFAELAQLDRIRATPADGQQHARSAGLQAQSVEPLPAGN
jgi:flagellar basal body rod protein FlgF